MSRLAGGASVLIKDYTRTEGFRRSSLHVGRRFTPLANRLFPAASHGSRPFPDKRNRGENGLRATDANANGGACRPFLFPPGSASRHKLTTHAARVATLLRVPADEINSYRLYCPLFALHEQKPISYARIHQPSPVQTANPRQLVQPIAQSLMLCSLEELN